MKQNPEICGNAPEASGMCETPVSSIAFNSAPVISSVTATLPNGNTFNT